MTATLAPPHLWWQVQALPYLRGPRDPRIPMLTLISRDTLTPAGRVHGRMETLAVVLGLHPARSVLLSTWPRCWLTPNGTLALDHGPGPEERAMTPEVPRGWTRAARNRGGATLAIVTAPVTGTLRDRDDVERLLADAARHRLLLAGHCPMVDAAQSAAP
ncbi:hypothetical protein [Allostreptomyces psammosilenae]|uniref:Uncharacterized protein n=1 Tax=Allostreptomyces psammosilenae TaxID=1892865 RepID=A0A852ZZV8_9ACTN|nr:hypothetical protein [Allostreptomyces psammosilenae]NYI07655.1 hypothetical protein [Allostreptomyces psammosilenae]